MDASLIPTSAPSAVISGVSAEIVNSLASLVTGICIDLADIASLLLSFTDLHPGMACSV